MLLCETARVRSGRASVSVAAASGVCGENSDYVLLFTFYARQRVDQASLARAFRGELGLLFSFYSLLSHRRQQVGIAIAASSRAPRLLRTSKKMGTATIVNNHPASMRRSQKRPSRVSMMNILSFGASRARRVSGWIREDRTRLPVHTVRRHAHADADGRDEFVFF